MLYQKKPANPSLGMTTTKTLRSVFSWRTYLCGRIDLKIDREWYIQGIYPRFTPDKQLHTIWNPWFTTEHVNMIGKRLKGSTILIEGNPSQKGGANTWCLSKFTSFPFRGVGGSEKKMVANFLFWKLLNFFYFLFRWSFLHKGMNGHPCCFGQTWRRNLLILLIQFFSYAS